jgi:ATP-dependent DNA helicase DinG
MKLLDKDLSQYELRKEQENCLNFLFETIHTEPIKKFFLLDLPTGVGKSILALSFIKRYLKEVNRDVRFDILTESKLLQRQYSEQFNSISNLWGRNTYQCTQFTCNCEQGKEFQKITKNKCEDCPYDNDREQFMGGKISLTNFHMFTLMRLTKLLDRRESNVLIVDEAHELEQVVSDFISVTLSNKTLSNIFGSKTESILNDMRGIITIEDFILFCSDKLLPIMKEEIGEIDDDIKKSDEQTLNRNLNLNSMLGGSSDEVELSKKLTNLKSFEAKILNLLTEYKNDDSNWVIQTEYDEKNRKKISIEPIWAHPYMKKYIWDKYDKVLMMSGTILNQEMFSYLNGIPEPLSKYYQIDSPFPVKHRPIYYIPLGKMTFKQKEETFKNYIPILNKILKKYKNKKGIIHTVTFELQDWVNENIDSDRFLAHNSDQKSKNFALKQHYTSDKPTVLLSPSMGTGIDLKDSRARFQVCLKVPYPSLGSIKNKMRLKTKPEWYAWITVSKLIQIYGRAVRNKDDHAHFIILDTCFSDIMKYNSHYIPDWVARAIKQVNV